MANLGSLVVDLALESAQFMSGMRAAAAQTSASSKAMSSALGAAKGAFAGLAGVLSVDFLVDQTLKAFDYADAIVDLSDRTGASTKSIQEFRYAAQLSGSSIESADAAMQKFAKNLGGAQAGNKALRDTFKELGVAIDQGTDPALRQLMDGIAKLPTVAMRQAKATELMGKSAGDLTALLGQGSAGFDTLAQAANAYGIVLDDGILRNAGQVNDKLDTMKMILNAQMAGAIVQNADALVALANGFMAAAGAAANFFAQMNVSKLMSVANGVNLNSDIPTLLINKLQGKSNDQISDNARAELKMTGAGRQALLTDLSNRHNAKLRAGADPNSNEMQAMRAEMRSIRETDARSRIGLKPPRQPKIVLPPIKGGGGPKPTKGASGPKEKTDEQLDLAWQHEWMGAQSDIINAQSELTNDVSVKAQNKLKVLGNDFSLRNSQIKDQTGTDQEVREGKKKFTKVQADQLTEAEKQLFEARSVGILRERDAQIAKDALQVQEGTYQNDLDLMNAQASLVKSSKDRRDAALKILDKEYDLQRIQLEAITHSETASKAEKDIAGARLAILGKLKKVAVQNAKDQNAGPLGQYLDNIPATANEINDQLEQVQVDGLDKLQDGLLGVIKGTESVGDAFHSMVDGILDGLLKIALQQMIIKPLGNLLFGGSDGGGGGIFGSLFKGILSGARANGGMTAAGNYLVGERGPEVVQIGSNANVISNRGISGVAGAASNDNGIAINVGPITSNDPAMVRQMVIEGVTAATPMITKQATDKTIAKLQRRNI